MNIVISVGHGKSKNGGYDSGAIGGIYHEFRISKEISKYLKEELSKYNCNVELINYSGNMYLYDRIVYIKNRKFDLALELHMNAFNKKANGSECYYKFKSSSGRQIAESISKNISAEFKAKNRGAKIKTYTDGSVIRDYFGFIREIPCESLLVETLFIDNESDRKNLITVEGQKRCAKAIARAIVSFYSLKRSDGTEPDTQTDLKKGDRVKIYGDRYATGQKIPLWVKMKIYTVADAPEKMSNGKERVLLEEINSYVYADDLKKEKINIAVGDTVIIKSGAVYGGLSSARGKKVPRSQLSPKKHTVQSIKTNMGVKEALLSDINSWVAISYLSGVTK